MELRSWQHLHFIQAVKGGRAIKILNVFHGKPALKLKKVEDIYRTGDSKSFNPLSDLGPKVEFEALPVGCQRTKGKSPCMLAEEKAVPIAEKHISEFHFNWEDDGVEGELNDLKLDAMTLKEIKEICKANKKKCARNDGSSRENVNIVTLVKEDCSNSQHKEDDYEAMEHLSCWKSRILKSRDKRKCRKSNASTSSHGAPLIVKSKEVPIDQAIFLPIANFPAPFDIKVEVPEPSYSDCQSTVKIESDSTNGYDNVISFSSMLHGEGPEVTGYCASEATTSMMSIKEPVIANVYTSKADRSVISSEELKAASDCRFEIQMSPFFPNEFQYCAFNEQSYEYVDQVDPTCIVDAGVKNIIDDNAEEINIQCADISSTKLIGEHFAIDAYPNDGHMETTNSCKASDSSDPQCCVSIEESYENVEHSHVRASVVEAMMMDNVEVISNESLDFSFPKINKEGSNVDLHPNDNSTVLVSPPKDHSHEMYDNSQSIPCAHEKVWNPSSNSQAQAHDIATVNSLPCVELEHSNSSNSHLYKDEAKDHEPFSKGSAISNPFNEPEQLGNSDLCSNSENNFVSVADDSCPGQESQCALSACSDAAGSCPSVSHPFNNESMESVDFEGHHHFQMQHPPERLFSFRKVISPASQKQLCEAMESSQLDDEEFYKYTRKLCYMKLTENSSSQMEEANYIKRGLATSTPKKAIKKLKIVNDGFSVKRTVQATHLSRPLPRFTKGCNSGQSCSESAISFSQQQMRDIESVATKLANELKSMKDIAEETLHSKVYLATSSKYAADEVRTAIQNATKVEESARKWLSIMARDCNRFCKIMQMTEGGSATSKNVTYKEKRKIAFADEVGGSLCDVRTFENDIEMASFSESSCEKLGIVD